MLRSHIHRAGPLTTVVVVVAAIVTMAVVPVVILIVAVVISVVVVIIVTRFCVRIGPVTRRNGSLLLRDHQIVVARRRSMRGAAVTRPRQVSRGHVRALGRHVSGDRSAASHVAVLRSLAVR